ncbi:MAG: winged helix-turn-helix transcriptional regulator [Anaerolineae bacterium]|nr:winged helix-turn-helix transcriptional regulator [Anaerolineae bacterium]
MPDTPLDAPGLSAFGSLRAEDEPWLRACFTLPAEFERVIAPRSTIIFGGPGSGKTALHQETRARCFRADGWPLRLLVDWRPAPLAPSAPADIAWVKQQAEQLFDRCAATLAEMLAQSPAIYADAPLWAQARLAWFIHQCLKGDPYLRFGALLDPAQPGCVLLTQLFTRPAPTSLFSEAGPEQVIAELTNALRATGLEGIWVLSDGLEDWSGVDAAAYVRGLGAFLSTLPLFEKAGLIYKLWAPLTFEAELSRAGGLARRRVDSVRLQWELAALRQLVECRVALALGEPQFDLAQLCPVAEFLPWLEKAGGDVPRAWLDQLAPLVKYYAAHGRQPLDAKTWLRLRREHPPRIYLDETSTRVLVGGREIDLEDLPAKSYEMLRYLYQHAGEVVGKGELYYQCYLGLERIPRTAEDKDYASPKDYEGLIDTSLWRLRRAIEPDPAQPVLLVSKRGHGVVLNVRW